MLYQLLLLQFAAHLLADFVFQPENWSDKKSEMAITRHHYYHCLVVFITSYLFSLDFGFWKAALLISILHFFMDSQKSYLILKYNEKLLQDFMESNPEKSEEESSTKYLFFLDQAFHIIVLILVSMAYDNWWGINLLRDFPLKQIATLTGFIFCAKPANILIKNIFSLYSLSVPGESGDNNSDKSLPNAGKLIGVTERFIALALVLLGQFTALGFIMTAKSILRFEEAKHNEYVLVGTLLSFGIAVLSGIIINTV